MNKAKPLMVFVGASGSGKTTLCDALAASPGFRRVRTSTSRPVRDEADRKAYHRAPFEELMCSPDYVLQAEFAGNAYAVRLSEFHSPEITLVMTGQPSILARTEKLCESLGRQLVVVHLRKPLEQRIRSMQARGDTVEEIANRLAHDQQDDEMLHQPVKPTLVVEDFIDGSELLRRLEAVT